MIEKVPAIVLQQELVSCYQFVIIAQNSIFVKYASASLLHLQKMCLIMHCNYRLYCSVYTIINLISIFATWQTASLLVFFLDFKILLLHFWFDNVSLNVHASMVNRFDTKINGFFMFLVIYGFRTYCKLYPLPSYVRH